MTFETRTRTMLGMILIGAGVAVAVLGYLGVSRETEVAFQLPYFASAAVGALLLFAAGGAVLVSTQTQRDTERIAELEEAVRLLASEVGDLVDELAPARRVAEEPAPARRAAEDPAATGAMPNLAPRRRNGRRPRGTRPADWRA